MGARGPLPRNVSPIREGVGHHAPRAPSRRIRPVAPTVPPWLDDYGKRLFGRLVRELEPLGILAVVDREILAAYCEAASVNKRAFEALTPNKRRGPDVLTPGRNRGDELVRAKAWGIVRESANTMKELSKLLLTNPASRMRAELPEMFEDDESDLD